MVKVTLIIPTAYTPEPYFSNCMKRVEEETENVDTDTNVEVIISEDGVIPEEMRKQYPRNAIVLQHEEPSGCGLARKRAIEVSTGDIITFLDSDDLLHRGWYKAVTDVGANAEFYFTNVEPNGFEEVIDTLDIKYGHFSHEMVWNKTYDGPALRECISKYNPPLMMTPAEDLLMNVVYLGETDFRFKQVKHILLDRFVRTSGLAWSTAADDRNRLKQMQISLDYMKENPRNENVYLWVSTYANIIEQRSRQQAGISGYKWFGGSKPGSVHEYVTIKLTDVCNLKCDYCSNSLYEGNKPLDSTEIADKTLQALDKWNELYTLPNAIVLSGGEPTLLDVECFLKIFDKYSDKTFLVYTNGYDIDTWLKKAPDNVLFKLHLVDEKVPLKYTCNDRILQMIVIGNDDALKQSIESLKCNKLFYVLDHSYKIVDSKKIEACRQVPGVYVIDISRDIVYPCCGTNCSISGTIENLPKKKDNPRCSSCKNACDNSQEIW